MHNIISFHSFKTITDYPQSRLLQNAETQNANQYSKNYSFSYDFWYDLT